MADGRKRLGGWEYKKKVRGETKKTKGNLGENYKN